MPKSPSQNRSRSSLPTLNTRSLSSFSMLQVSTEIRSTGQLWWAIQLFVTVHGLVVMSYAEIRPLREPTHSRSFTPSRLSKSDDDTFTTSTHCAGAPPGLPIDHMLMFPPSCARNTCPGCEASTVPAVTAPRCSVGSSDRPTEPGVKMS